MNLRKVPLRKNSRLVDSAQAKSSAETADAARLALHSPASPAKAQPAAWPPPSSLSEAQKMRALPWSLAHITLNNIFYTWTFGSSIFPLFLSELGLPKDQIGLILSFFPFTGLLALVLGKKVAVWGRKRVFLLGYGLRKPAMAALLLLPVLLQQGSYQVSLAFLFGIVLLVAVLRALAETAFIPWMQEYVPNAVRGKYAAASSVLTTLTSILALAAASRVIEQQAGLSGYMILIGLGAAIGLAGVVFMYLVPGGSPIPADPQGPTHLQAMRLAFHENLNFRLYLGGMGFATLPLFMLASFIPIFIKEELGIPADSIVQIEIYSMLGSAAASVIAGLAADRIGSRKVMMPGYVMLITIPLGWLAVSLSQAANLTHNTAVLLAACSVLYFFNGAFLSMASIASVRMLYNHIIPPENNTPYSSIYYAWAGLVGGSAPILAGYLLNYLSGWQYGLGLFAMDGYRLIFLISTACFTLSVFFFNRIRP
jgi:MFS family permease